MPTTPTTQRRTELTESTGVIDTDESQERLTASTQDKHVPFAVLTN